MSTVLQFKNTDTKDSNIFENNNKKTTTKTTEKNNKKHQEDLKKRKINKSFFIENKECQIMLAETNIY